MHSRLQKRPVHLGVRIQDFVTNNGEKYTQAGLPHHQGTRWGGIPGVKAPKQMFLYCDKKWPVHLGVRIQDFHSWYRGSIPLRAT